MIHGKNGKTAVLSVLLLAVSSFSLWAGAKQDAESHTVAMPEGFKEERDIENKKPGKYNFFIEASDKGGNTTIAGPENIFLDPESDLPIARITNPRPSMRVPSNIGIVGTCVDDDAVDYVELIFSHDLEHPVVAEGSEFWSYYLDTSELEDGWYTVSAYGVDVNGLKGKPFSVTWSLDRNRPQTVVQSHAIGALVNGKVPIKGTVYDGNGIAELSYSMDRGVSYTDIPFKAKKEAVTANFSFSLDTKKFNDGPKIILFKAIDKQKTEGSYMFLLFVDNTAPDIRITYPANPNEPVNGLFSVAGFVKDVVGLTKVSWKLGDKTGDFDLVIGNPWWVKEFDLRGEEYQKLKNIDLEIRAVDVSGNMSVVKRRLIVDRNADLPRVTLAEPALVMPPSGKGTPVPAEVLGEDLARLRVRGLAEDDDGVAMVYCSIDNGAPIEFVTTGWFQTLLDDLPVGVHSLQVWAKDISGVEGTKTEIKNLVSGGRKPSASITHVMQENGKITEKTAFYSGMEINNETNPVFALQVNSDSAITEVSYRFGDREPVTVPIKTKISGELIQDIPLPVDVSYGQVVIHIEATDIYQRKAVVEEVVRVEDLSKPHIGAGESAEIRFFDERMKIDHIPLDQPFWGYLPGIKAKAVRLESETGDAYTSGVYKVELIGNAVRISRAGAAAPKPVETALDQAEQDSEFDEAEDSEPTEAILDETDPTPAPVEVVLGEAGQTSATEETLVIVVESAEGFVYKSKPFVFTPGDSVRAPLKITMGALDGREWIPGMSLNIPRGGRKTPYTLTATAETASQTAVLNSAVFDFGGRKVNGLMKQVPKTTTWNISVTIPQDLPTGFVPTRVDVSTAASKTDSALSAVLEGGFFILRSAAGTVYDEQGFRWLNAKTIENGVILMDKDTVLTGIYNGRPLNEAVVTQENGAISVEMVQFDESDNYKRVNVRFTEDGQYAFALMLSDVDGRVYTTENYTALVDSEDPTLEITTPEVNGSWVKNKVAFGLKFGDANLGAVEYSLDMGKNWVPCDGEWTKDTVLMNADISSMKDGLVRILSRIKDSAHREMVVSFDVNKDSVAPAPRLIVPLSGEDVNGIIRLGIIVEEKGKLVSSVYENPPIAETPPEGAADAEKSEEIQAIEAVTQEMPPEYFITPSFLTLLVGTDENPLSADIRFTFMDAAGNVAVLENWEFLINKETDKPIAQVNLPEENEVVIRNFTISGTVYDDDKVAKIWYFIDYNEETEVMADNSYSIPIEISSLVDNEHSVTIIPEDIYGIRGDPIKRNFRVSLEEPKADMILPSFDVISKGTLELKGVASDRNEILTVQVSIDNGNTYNNVVMIHDKVTGITEWSYTFNSKIIQDGTHVVFIKVWDKYNVSAMYSGMINIDNTAPDIEIASPIDGLTSVGPVFLSGRAIDSMGLSQVNVNIRSITGGEVPPDLANIAIERDSIFTKEIDFSSMEDGLYNIDISAEDFAENISHQSRNVLLSRGVLRNFVDVLYPLNGEYVQGEFNLYGYLGGTDTASHASLYLDGSPIDTVKVTETGFFCFNLNKDKLKDGVNILSVMSDFDGKDTVFSPLRRIEYNSVGAWVTIDSFTMGDFAFERPWISGRVGYVLNEIDLQSLGNKKTDKKVKTAIAQKKPLLVEISFDNGITFTEVKRRRVKGPDGKPADGWRYRIENQDMREGIHDLILRATMENGETAVSRTLIQIDKTFPQIKVIAPEPGGRYNQTLEFTALSNDDIALKSVLYTLRKGDKGLYAVPGFIQGLYFDGHFWGATFYDVGLGLTFFDDNVKLQAQFGQFTEEMWSWFSDDSEIRYGGDVLGLKLLANVYALPFASFGGPDWEWLSASVAIGANFSYFMKTQSGSPTMMSAMIMQLEFPKITIPKIKRFRTFAFYTEFQLWFTPTDVDTSVVSVPTTIFHITGGLRFNIF
ncbi:MAG: hypothetical protein LBG05_00740 [Treponema sp.]|jgi:hypothetical protein|nr:hypothetical protein [Treponema sp.]